MGAPFIFGKIASGTDFTDREKESHRLIANFHSGINSILISPRRWGKSSLVLKSVTSTVKANPKVKVCFIDVFNIRSESEFYEELARQVLTASSGKFEEIIQTSKKFLSKLIPKLSISPEGVGDFTIGFDVKELKGNPDEILDLSERIAESKKIKLIICIDEFQNISAFDNPLAFQKKLRSHWQKHKHTTYCLYGSKRHMMMDVFASPSMPFYKFGDILFLEKIAESDWVKFIKKRFKSTGKSISPEAAKLVAVLVECHPYYVQQLAQQSWLRTAELCDESIVTEAHDVLMHQLSLLFQGQTDRLSNTQVNFLKALIEGVKKLSAKDTLDEYRLGTSANVLKIKSALENREIIDINGTSINILDPVYKSWLRKYYFMLG